MSFHQHPGGVIQRSAGPASFGFVYAVGRLTTRFPEPDIEKEYDQVAAAMGVDSVYAVLEQSSVIGSLETKGADNAYLAREMEWVFTIDGMDAWRVTPATLIELGNMVEALNPANKSSYQVLIGIQEGLGGDGGLPGVICNRIFHFDPDAFADQVVKRAGEVGAKVEKDTVTTFFQQLLQFVENPGNSETNRAINYLALEYVDFYIKKAEMDAENKPFTGLTTQPSTMSGDRSLVDVILAFNDRKYGTTERYFCRVDVTGQFPFLATKPQTYLGS